MEINRTTRKSLKDKMNRNIKINTKKLKVIIMRKIMKTEKTRLT